ncbi:RND family efflux transporter, MFP subunit [Variovorax sp. YR750]|uniref:HlyD family secretion protein n=1 Tax=Variovorax gossypii TaxID=1679495 RepID=A0A3S0GWW9_9BURK|nr:MULTISPECIES: HlyD family secretion protein [Variovorax]MDP9606351.1 multidrug resistance efflux pump [Variovorax paradoxus]RTQ30646.1 HlyD family secretion protein [Variovorax gossypii]SEM50739.1 RND family efflux transporter, MFP subunit [Variovorax sp. YR750]
MNTKSVRLPAWLPRPVPSLFRMLLTALIAAAACWAALQLWDHYELAPWTRNGRVRADVVQVAPDVSGMVAAVAVRDNQPVGAGELLFSIDAARFTLALQQAEAAVAAQRIVIGNQQVALAQAQRERRRNDELEGLVAQEVREQSRLRVEQARGALLAAETALRQAQVALEVARLNLQRSGVRAPAAGRVTNLDLRQGAYATAGHPALALVADDSIYVEGYFEENKLARIRLGDRVRVTPMDAPALEGEVESISAGIGDRDRSTGANLLPSVNPTFNWVRLAQRVPVRVKLDPLPANVRLVVGQTVSVEVMEDRAASAAAAARVQEPRS